MKKKLLVVIIIVLIFRTVFYFFKPSSLKINKHRAGYPYPLTPVKHLKKRISKNSVIPPSSGKVLHKKRIIKAPKYGQNKYSK